MDHLGALRDAVLDYRDARNQIKDSPPGSEAERYAIGNALEKWNLVESIIDIPKR